MEMLEEYKKEVNDSVNKKDKIVCMDYSIKENKDVVYCAIPKSLLNVWLDVYQVSFKKYIDFIVKNYSGLLWEDGKDINTSASLRHILINAKMLEEIDFNIAKQSEESNQSEQSMNTYYNIKKNFGFGCMRLPMKDDEVDYDEFTKMVDTFIEEGFNYFDTAHGYLNGKSEIALRECLTSRYPRESYVLANKLSTHHFSKQEDIRPLFKSQLEACGVEYFDFYLMHAQDKNIFDKYKECNAYETAFELKSEGYIRHVGISFHDKAAVLDQILAEYPDIEVVQIQFNYVDYDDPSVESRKVYEVCRNHNKPVIIMEPVKGGCLVNLPVDAQAIFDELDGGSNASYAIRFAAGFEGVMMVLSGMGNMEMMNDNISYMKDFKPLNDKEHEAIKKVCDIFNSQNHIPCTACKYCTERCPQNIPIPDIFACLNDKKTFNTWNPEYYYGVHTQKGGKASECIACGICEEICPQHLKIRDLLKDVAAEFEKQEEADESNE